MVKDLVLVKDKVKNLLIKYPSVRDCDKLLFLAYSKTYCGLDSSLDGSYKSFKEWYLEKMPAFESLTRARRKIQEKNKELRGKKRKYRMDEQQSVIEWSKL